MSDLPYRSGEDYNFEPVVGSSDHQLFIGVLIAGVVGAGALKMLGAPAGVAAVWLVFCLLAYAGLVRTVFYLAPDRAGDNLYYLGFLFTIASLGWTLYNFDEISTDSLIENFGLALVSTFFGMLLRVWFLQFRLDPADAEKIVRQDLLTTTREFTNQLHLSSQALREFSETTQSDLRAFKEDTVSSVRSVIENLTEEATERITGYNNEITKSSARANRALIRSVEKFERIETAVLNSIEQNATALENISASLSSLDGLSKALDPQISSLASSVVEITQGWEHATVLYAKFLSTLEQVEVTYRKVSETLTEASQLEKPIQDFREHVLELNRSAKRWSTNFNKKFDALDLVKDRAEGMNKSLQEANGAIDDFKKQVLNIVEAGKGLEEMQASVESLPTAVVDLNTALSEMTTEAGAALEPLLKQKETISKLQSEMEVLASSAVDTNKKFYSSIGELSSLMVERLKNGR